MLFHLEETTVYFLPFQISCGFGAEVNKLIKRMKAYFDKSVSDILIIKHVLMYQHIPVINDVQTAL